MINHIERKHYIIGGLILGLAFLLQPFALLFLQVEVAPRLVSAITGKNTDGTVSVEGREIDTQNLKIRGNNQAEIYLVEFSDYQCPFCNRFHDTPKQVVAESNGKVAWVWKHFPLYQIHPEAKPSAIAAECVNRLGGMEKFWQFSDMLVANQGSLSANMYKTEAQKLGINAKDFSTCIADPAMGDEIDRNQKEGEDLGVSGTPNTFVVRNENGKLTVLENINGALPKSTVDSIIAKYTK